MVIEAIMVPKSLPDNFLILMDRIFNLMGKNAFLLILQNIALFGHTHGSVNVITCSHYAPDFAFFQLSNCLLG